MSNITDEKKQTIQKNIEAIVTDPNSKQINLEGLEVNKIGSNLQLDALAIEHKLVLCRDILSIVKSCEENGKSEVKKVLVQKLGTLAIIVILGVVISMLTCFFLIYKNKLELDWGNSLLAIIMLNSSFKILAFILEKMVDYTFTVDKTLIKVLTEIHSNEEKKSSIQIIEKESHLKEEEQKENEKEDDSPIKTKLLELFLEILVFLLNISKKNKDKIFKFIKEKLES